MSNKKTVEAYMAAYRVTDHAAVLSLLTEDVIWEMPGFFYHEGKVAFDKEIEPPDADGHPDIIVDKMIEEGDTVVAEGRVKARLKGNRVIDAVFCDVFHFRGEKICKLTSYVMFKTPAAPYTPADLPVDNPAPYK